MVTHVRPVGAGVLGCLRSKHLKAGSGGCPVEWLISKGSFHKAARRVYIICLLFGP